MKISLLLSAVIIILLVSILIVFINAKHDKVEHYSIIKFIESVRDLEEYNRELFIEITDNITYFIEIYDIIRYEQTINENTSQLINLLISLKNDIVDKFAKFNVSISDGVMSDKCIQAEIIINKILTVYILNIYNDNQQLQNNDEIPLKLLSVE